MKLTKVMIAVLVLLAIVVLSVINTVVTGVTGNPVLEVSQEFPGLSFLFILVISVLGIFIIRKKLK